MKIMLSVFYCVGVTVLIPLLSRGTAADDPSPRAFDPEVTVQPIEGTAVTGRLVSLAEQTLSLGDEHGESQLWRVDEVRSLRIHSRTMANAAAPPLVLLANDDVLCGEIIAVEDESLTLNWTGSAPPQSISVPLETVRSFAFQQPGDEFDRIRLRRIWALLELTSDRLISTDNTHLDGELIGLTDGRVRIDTSLGPFAAPVEEVIAVVMNSELMTRPEPKGPYYVLSFRDGSRVSCSSLQSPDGGNLTGRTVWGGGGGGELVFPLEQLTRVQFLGNRVLALASLTPSAYKFTPYLTQMYPLVTNRNVKGGPLQLRGETYGTGLGVSSQSEVTYDLTEGGFDHFEAVVGIDDMTGGQGNVVFAVEVDGRRVYESKPLSGRSPAQTVGPLDVASAKTLKLVVEFGQYANIQDVADWCDAVLTKGLGNRE